MELDRQSLRRQIEESKRITLPSSKRQGIYQQENLSDCNPRKRDSNEVKESTDTKTISVETSQFETIYVWLQYSFPLDQPESVYPTQCDRKGKQLCCIQSFK